MASRKATPTDPTAASQEAAVAPSKTTVTKEVQKAAERIAGDSASLEARAMEAALNEMGGLRGGPAQPQRRADSVRPRRELAPEGRPRERDRRDERRPRGREREQDPAMEAYAIAKEMSASEDDDREERRLRRMGRRAHAQRDRYGRTEEDGDPYEGARRRPVRAFQRRRRPDTTVITDSQGLPVDTTGKVVRWVREEDAHGRTSQQRVAEFRHYGYDPILDPHTKKPIRSHLGLAMAGPPEGYAERILDRMPQGALSRDELLNATVDAVDDINRRARGEVCKLVQQADHETHQERHLAPEMPNSRGGGDSYDDDYEDD